MASETHFTSALFEFLGDLAENNDREWFARNKARYETHLREPAMRFIMDFGPRLREISPHFRADPRRSGGSLFRIYRDVRFSKDKSPYKTHAGIHFRHEAAKSAHAPGFYLHMDPNESFVGVGLWHPDSPTLRSIREAIVDDPDARRSATGDASFGQEFELRGDRLKRIPRGFDRDHPLATDLMWKDHVGVAKIHEKEVTAPAFIDRFTELCRAASPYVSWLCTAIDQPF